MIIKLLYKQGSGKIIQALEEWDWTARGCPEPVINITDEIWNEAQGKENRVVDGVLVSTAIVRNTIFAKLAIRRACRTLGLEGKLNALLEASDVFRADWTDAQDIDLSDPVLLQALQAGTFTQEEINSIKNNLQ